MSTEFQQIVIKLLMHILLEIHKREVTNEKEYFKELVDDFDAAHNLLKSLNNQKNG